MKQIISFKMITVAALLALTVGCATTNSNSDLLSAAGFKLRPADTPKKQQLLQTLTPGKLTLITWKGKQFYVHRTFLTIKPTWERPQSIKPINNCDWPSS